MYFKKEKLKRKTPAIFTSTSRFTRAKYSHLQCKTEAHIEVAQATQMTFAGKAGSAACQSQRYRVRLRVTPGGLLPAWYSEIRRLHFKKK